jgi:PadR family transcriptional regulator, regulatory protein AphA
MSLRHAILVTLADEAATGYEITKRFERGLGNFWQASHQQIYQELKRMAGAKLVSVKTVAQETRPTKKVHKITAAGVRELERWLKLPTKDKPLRNAFLVKLFAAHLVDRAHIIAELEAQLTEHRATLAHYRELETRYFPAPEKLDFKMRCRYLTLRLGIASERADIKWCRESLAVLNTS